MSICQNLTSLNARKCQEEKKISANFVKTVIVNVFSPIGLTLNEICSFLLWIIFEGKNLRQQKNEETKNDLDVTRIRGGKAM